MRSLDNQRTNQVMKLPHCLSVMLSKFLGVGSPVMASQDAILGPTPKAAWFLHKGSLIRLSRMSLDICLPALVMSSSDMANIDFMTAF